MLLLRLSLIILLSSMLTECRIQLPQAKQKQSSQVKNLVKKTERAITQSSVYKFSTRYWYYLLFATWVLYIQPADTFANWYYIKAIRDYIGGALPKEKKINLDVPSNQKDISSEIPFTNVNLATSSNEQKNIPLEVPISIEPINTEAALCHLRSKMSAMDTALDQIKDNTDKTKYAGPINDFFKSLKPYAKLEVDTPFKFSPCIFYKPMCNDFKHLLKKIKALFYGWLDENESEREEEDSCECREEC
jgi:hypothetical protein